MRRKHPRTMRFRILLILWDRSFEREHIQTIRVSCASPTDFPVRLWRKIFLIERINDIDLRGSTSFNTAFDSVPFSLWQINNESHRDWNPNTVDWYCTGHSWHESLVVDRYCSGRSRHEFLVLRHSMQSHSSVLVGYGLPDDLLTM